MNPLGHPQDPVNAERIEERLHAIKAARDSGSYVDAQGDYIDGVVDALEYALGEGSEPMPWIK